MNMKLEFPLIIILGYLFHCITSVPTLERSNRISREIHFSLSKILALTKDFYKAARDFDSTSVDGVELLNALRKSVSLIVSTPYRVAKNTVNRVDKVIDFGLSIPGRIENATINVVFAPYHLAKYALNVLGQDTKKTVDYGVRVEKKVEGVVANITKVPYNAAKSVLHVLDRDTKKAENYGLHVGKQVTGAVINVAMLPYTVTKRFLNWIGI